MKKSKVNKKQFQCSAPEISKKQFFSVDNRYGNLLDTVDSRDDNKFVFSFILFSREHEYFNLNGEKGPVRSNWFIKMLDRLKIFSTKTMRELKESDFELHAVDWENANVKPPKHLEQYEFWQFRISKGLGRVVGIVGKDSDKDIEESIFYIVWLDAYHNLTNSQNYSKAKKYPNLKVEDDPEP